MNEQEQLHYYYTEEQKRQMILDAWVQAGILKEDDLKGFEVPKKPGKINKKKLEKFYDNEIFD